MADAFVAWLQAPDGFGNPEAMARRLGISYVIWNNQTWRAYDPARGWTDYNGCATKKKLKKRAYDNTCHRTHVHISFSWDGALKRTSYYTGFVACPAPLPPRCRSPPVPTVPGLPVPVPCPSRCRSSRPGDRPGAAAGAGPAARHQGRASARSPVRAGCTPTSGSTCPSSGAAGSPPRGSPRSCCGCSSSARTRPPPCRSGRPGAAQPLETVAAGRHRPGGRGDRPGRYGGQREPAARRGDGAPARRRRRLRPGTCGLTRVPSGPAPRLVGR